MKYEIDTYIYEVDDQGQRELITGDTIKSVPTREEAERTLQTIRFAFSDKKRMPE